MCLDLTHKNKNKAKRMKFTKTNRGLWNKHTSFATGIDRMLYVKTCLDGFLKLVDKSSKKIESNNNKNHAMNTLHKRFFFTEEDILCCSHFSCIVCAHTIHVPSWIHNTHFMGTVSPICPSCILT